MKLGVLCINSTSEEVARPIWRAVKAIGLSGDDLDELIDEARALDTNVWISVLVSDPRNSTYVR